MLYPVSPEHINGLNQNIIGSELLGISDISEVRHLCKTARIGKDNTHLSHTLFTLLMCA